MQGLWLRLNPDSMKTIRNVHFPPALMGTAAFILPRASGVMLFQRSTGIINRRPQFPLT